MTRPITNFPVLSLRGPRADRVRQPHGRLATKRDGPSASFRGDQTAPSLDRCLLRVPVSSAAPHGIRVCLVAIEDRLVMADALATPCQDHKRSLSGACSFG